MQESNDEKKWYRVSLRFQGDDLAADEIEDKLGFQSSSIGRKGEHINDNSQYAKYSTNIWVWSITRDSSLAFEKQIEALLTLLEPRKGILEEILSLPDVEGELFLGFGSISGQGSAHFPAALLSRIGALGLALNLDLYVYNEAENGQ